MIIRISFKLGEELKFLSHLDILRLFERAMKRAKIPIAYSKGFNPRPQIIFTPPLPLGMSSTCEYADIEFVEEFEPNMLINKLNEQLPQGVMILAAVEIQKAETNIMNAISAAEYDIEVDKADKESLNKVINEVLGLSELVIMKKAKKGMKPKDIRPMIYSIVLVETESNLVIRALVSSKVEENLRADILFEIIKERYQGEIAAKNIKRTGLYTKKDGMLVSPV